MSYQTNWGIICCIWISPLKGHESWIAAGCHTIVPTALWPQTRELDPELGLNLIKHSRAEKEAQLWGNSRSAPGSFLCRESSSSDSQALDCSWRSFQSRARDAKISVRQEKYNKCIKCRHSFRRLADKCWMLLPFVICSLADMVLLLARGPKTPNCVE